MFEKKMSLFFISGVKLGNFRHQFKTIAVFFVFFFNFRCQFRELKTYIFKYEYFLLRKLNSNIPLSHFRSDVMLLPQYIMNNLKV